MEMLASAQVELGLSKAEFFELTPAQFAALQRVRLDQIYRRNYRSGIITCVIRSALGEKEARPMDFFESRTEKQEMIDTAAAALRRQMAIEATGKKHG